ncbi:unnamed protein product [Ophioblennius macclurei]
MCLFKVNQPHRRHYPLINQGATCYLSSILQVLFMTPEIHNRLDPASRDLDKALAVIFRSLKETACGTENITKCLGIADVCQQRDAAECLEMVLKKISPKASQVFQGQLKETTKCPKGHVIIEESDPFLNLPLSLRGGHKENCSVETSFSEFFRKTVHTGDDMVYCCECKEKTEATSESEMVDSPQIMTLLLKRFDFDFNTGRDVKLNSCVDIPFTIQTTNKIYTLYGMVNHMGSLGGGHYTATVQSKEDKTWYNCDDTHVTEVEEQPFARNGKYSSSTAYLLMYRASASQIEEFIDEEGELLERRQKLRNIQKHSVIIFFIVFGFVLLVILVILFLCVL